MDRDVTRTAPAFPPGDAGSDTEGDHARSPAAYSLRTLVQPLIAAARRRRAARLQDLIERLAAAKGGCRIIDLGGEPGYWKDFDLERLRALNVSIAIVNLAPQTVADPMFSFLQGDACSVAQFEDASFDLAHSNSVIEHVGEWDAMRAFAGEVRRLAPSYYVQTPYFWFPIEPHFMTPLFHWLPEPTRVQALLKRGFGHHARERTVDAAIRTIRSARLLDRAQFAALFPDARYEHERAFGLVKSLIGVRVAG
ncbi:MAG: class I SAM-dependent methyltransferase [Caulobacteraceae bacterium]|nr:class I SAM-dependent methyltransferase [Caulobacteraceae bacterium]